MRAYIGLGSNLSDPKRQLDQAVQTLRSHPSLGFIAVAPYYASRPWGVLDQPDFLNTVVSVTSSLSPLDLLKQLQAIENQQGRVRGRRWGERCIDCDLLLFGDLRLESPELTLPHLYLEEREFVLAPLADLAPQLVLPSGYTVQARLAEIRKTGVSVW
jgi:2-amino-4-hydroxy-6-hydroxymethyldihydropteridine diphosphokinase